MTSRIQLGRIVWVVASAAAVCHADVWGTYQGNASHTGYVPVSLTTNQFSVKWVKNFGSGVVLNPVTAGDGKVFVSRDIYFNDVESFFALDAATGATVWSKNFGSIYSVNPPAFAYGNVYIQTGNHASDTYLRAYDAATGGFVFRAPHQAQWEDYYAPTIYDGKVYVDGGYYGGMYSFDAHSGTQQWFRALPQYDDWTPAVDSTHAYAYVGEHAPGLYILNRATGQQEAMIPDPLFDWNGWSMSLAPVLGELNDVLAIHDGRLISFDVQAKNIRWQLSRSFTGQVALANNIIYAIDGGALTAWDELTGAYLWGWEVPSGSLTDTLILTDSHAIVRSSNYVYAVDLNTHDDDWSYAAAGHLALSEGTLYIAGSGGLLTAIAVPEPAAFSLLAAGLLLCRRRRGCRA